MICHVHCMNIAEKSSFDPENQTTFAPVPVCGLRESLPWPHSKNEGHAPVRRHSPLRVEKFTRLACKHQFPDVRSILRLAILVGLSPSNVRSL